MRKAMVTIAAVGALLCAGRALATPTPSQLCDFSRITAWKVYTSCVDTVVAKEAKDVVFDQFKAFWKCRHAYFKKWTAFQTKAALAGSACVGTRFTDNGDQTVTDNLTALMWEKKDDASGIHDKDDSYSWSSGPPYKGDGTAFATFLTGTGTGLNVAGFAGANDWRLPTVAELQTILFDFPCTGAGLSGTCSCTGPCIDPALDATNTQSGGYWSATIDLPNPPNAWNVFFTNGNLNVAIKDIGEYVRAVRAGL